MGKYLKIQKNGVDISGKGLRQSEALLEEYLPDLTPSLIGSVIVLGQGLPQKFTNNSPSGRKEVLEKLFRSDFMIQDLKDRISKRKTEISDELRKVQDDKLVTKTKLENILETINSNTTRLTQLRECNNLEAKVNTLHKEIAELEELLAATVDKFENYKNNAHEYEVEYYELKNKKIQSLADIDVEYSDTLSNLQTELNDVTGQLRFAKSELAKVREIKDICPTCGQKILGVEKPDIAKYEESYNTLLKKFDQLNNTMAQVKQEISDKKLSATIELDKQLDSKNYEIEHNSKVADDVSLDLHKLSSEHTSKKKILDDTLTLQNTRLFEMSQLDEANERYEVLKDNYILDIKYNEECENELSERLSIINKFNTTVTRDFRGYLLNDIIVYINSRAKEYCKDVFGTDLIDFSLDGNNLLISYNSKEYEALSGGERQKVDLIIQFAIRDMLCRHTSFSSNIIVMDEIFDNLDDIGCQKILDLITKKLYDISSIFIISHHGNELNIPYDDIIRITKDNSGVTRLES